MRTRLRWITVLLIAVGLVSITPLASQAASCQPAWLPTFGGEPGIGASNVFAITTFDDGSGPALYAGGDFTNAGGIPASRIVKWNGVSWSALGSGMNDTVNALVVFNDGSGPALYAGGLFTSAGGAAVNRIAKWNGTSWSALGSGMNGEVLTLTVSSVGGSAALYAGGDFTSAGGAAANRIAKWNGASWTALGGGLNDRARALATYDDGGGAALYAGGDFTNVGGHVPANHVAKWNGASWTTLGSGTNDSVRALAVFNGGSGAALCASGAFSSAGGAAANRIAKWNGASWSTLGAGMDNEVAALTVFDDGGGSALYASGVFANAGGASIKGIAKWNGASWSGLGSGISIGVAFSAPATVHALSSWDNGTGPALYAGGNFINAGGVAANRIARWKSASWSPLSNGGISNVVNSFAIYDDGSGAALYAAGSFMSVDGSAANRVAKWNGVSWSALGNGLKNVDGTGTVKAIAVYDDGSGPALYAAGLFTFSGSSVMFHMARWNGTSWSAVGGAVDHGAFALHVFDDGSGPALYAGGNFEIADTLAAVPVAAPRVAKWNGTNWSALGTGMDNTVGAFASYDDGSGPALYAGGAFTTAGGALAPRIARWNGTSWSAVGGSMDLAPTSSVAALAVYDDGSGPALYAGGGFTLAGGTPAAHIARWNGTSWSAVGGGMSGDVLSLTVYDDGSGPVLVAGGNFETAGGVSVHGVARWDGVSWTALGSGSMLGVSALAGYDDGTGPALYAGGLFETSPAGDSYVAKWACPSIASVPGCSGNPASLSALALSAPLGAALPLHVAGLAAQNGLSLVYFGAAGVNASGCGLVVPGLGELLLALAPSPLVVASAILAGGASNLAPLVPNQSGLAGLTVYLQGAAVDPSIAQPIELTNALAATLGP